MQKIKEKTFNYFTDNSIPEVPVIFTCKLIFFKITLTLLLLGLFGLGLWNIAFAVKDFYNYDVVTSIERVNPENVTFPAITICTDGDFRKDYYVNGVFNKSKVIMAWIVQDI